MSSPKKETPASRQAKTGVPEKLDFSPFPNTCQEASAMSKFTPPEGFVPNYDPADPEQPNFWNGPCESGEGVDVLSEWTPDHGVRVIMGSSYVGPKDILDLAQDLIRLYVAVDNAQREHEANTRGVAR